MNWFITEPPPHGLAPENAKRFNYDLFTCRTGNIYTTSLLRQWIAWAAEDKPVPPEVWQAESGRVIDPFRPRIEPGGFAGVEELRRSRAETIRAFATAVRDADIFVFTLGLTESWHNAPGGYEYPMCPGTIGGTFDPVVHQFSNQRHGAVLANLTAAIAAMRRVNPGLRVLLTVSPVPLTATAGGDHVLVATTRSKCVLRAVAAELAETDPLVDYFPSYEIIASPPTGGVFYEPNKREVNPHGVSVVMRHFFSAIGAPDTGTTEKAAPRQAKVRRRDAGASRTDVVCEEQLLASFGPRS
jgi:hypothetical protein